MKRRTHVYLVFFLTLSIFCCLCSTTTADWTNLGLYGGQIYDIAIDPDDPNKMFAAAYYGDGLYRTLDGGTTWSPVLTGSEGGALDGEATFRNTSVRAVEIAPSSDTNADNHTVWAVHNYAVEKSTSGGADESWTHIRNEVMQDDCINCPDDATPDHSGSEQFRFCTALAIDPSNPQTVYVGTGGPYKSDKRGTIYKTTDGGDTWTKLGMVATGFDPDGAGTRYEARNLNNEFYSKVVAIAVHPTASNIVWAVDFNEIFGQYLAFLYISTDGGQTWSWDVGVEAWMGESGLAVKPDEPNVVYMGTLGGIARIEYPDDGEGNILWGNTVSRTYPIATGGNNVRALAFDPQNANILFAATGSEGNFRLRKSLDGGLTFSNSNLYSHDQQLIHLAPHPTNSNVIFGGDRLKGVFQGNFADSNYTWVKRSQGIKSIKISDIAIDPNDSSHYLAATMAGVFELQSGQGNSWTPTSSFVWTQAYSVEFDGSDTDGSTFFAGGESSLYKTDNHGLTWSDSDWLDYPHYVSDIAIDPGNPDIVFITTRDPGKVFRSPDGGGMLEKVLDSGGTYYFNALAVDPTDSTHIYAGGGNYFGWDLPGDLYKSTASGNSGTWSSILPAVTVNALLIDPSDPDIIYAGCGHGNGTEVPLYKSVDGGSTWSESYEGIPGEPVRHGIWGSSASDLFILKHTGSVAKGGHDDENILHYGGSDWTNMDIGTSTLLYGIWGSSGEDVFAVGEAGTIVHYDGSEWYAMTSGISEELSGVAGSGSDNVYAVGKSGTILHYTGGSWSALDSGTYKDLRSVWSTTDGSHVFAVGAYGTVMHTDDGTTWTKQATSTTEALLGVWGSSAVNVFAVGNAGTILKYNGSIWVAMGSGTTENLSAVWGTSDGVHVYAVGDHGTILHFTSGTWSTMSSGTAARLYHVWGNAANHVYAVGHYGALLFYNGSTWTDETVGFNEFPAWNGVTDLKFKIEGGNRNIYASTGRQGIYASSDGGTTWTNMSTPPYEVYALATGSVIVGTQGGVLAMSGYGLLYGQVTDNLGAPIPGVSVSTDIGKTVVSASDGRWSMGLKAGAYNVSAAIPGYGLVSEANVPIYDATGTFVGLEFSGRSIYVSIDNREVLGTGGSFIGPGGRVTPTVGNFTWSLGNGDGELMALYGDNATFIIEPAPGQHANVMVDGQPHGTNIVDFVDLTEGHSIEAVFTLSSIDNLPPMADAGADRTVVEGTTVVLDGTGSSDPDGDALTFFWTQTKGTSVTLSDDTSSRPTFVTNPVDDGSAALTFQLTVRDADNLDTDEVVITIQDSGSSGGGGGGCFISTLAGE